MSYSEHSSNAILGQITLELQAAHIYRGFSHYFDHPKIALPGFSKYFMTQANEELRHADAFITYHQMRGGSYSTVALTSVSNDNTPLQALEQALILEKHVLANLNEVHDCGDKQTQIFVEDYINHQTKGIAEIQTLITKAQRVSSDPVGTYLLDRELQ